MLAQMWKKFVFASPLWMYVSLARCLILDFLMAAKPVLLIFRRRHRSSSCCVSVLNSCAASSCNNTSLMMASCNHVSPTFSLRHRLRPLATHANFMCNRLMGNKDCTGLLQTCSTKSLKPSILTQKFSKRKVWL